MLLQLDFFLASHKFQKFIWIFHQDFTSWIRSSSAGFSPINNQIRIKIYHHFNYRSPSYYIYSLRSFHGKIPFLWDGFTKDLNTSHSTIQVQTEASTTASVSLSPWSPHGWFGVPVKRDIHRSKGKLDACSAGNYFISGMSSQECFISFLLLYTMWVFYPVFLLAKA